MERAFLKRKLIPNRNFPKLLVNGKRPMEIVSTALINTIRYRRLIHKTGFEYRQMRSIGTSSALARNKTRLISLETSLVRNEARLARR